MVISCKKVADTAFSLSLQLRGSSPRQEQIKSKKSRKYGRNDNKDYGSSWRDEVD